MTRHNAILTEINHMQQVYSSSINTTVVQKVSFITNNGWSPVKHHRNANGELTDNGWSPVNTTVIQKVSVQI
jgi:hypothetical protein